jgi:hypothetical protein
MGEMLIMLTASSSEEAGDGMGEAVVFGEGGSCSSGDGLGEWKPTGLSGRRRVPLLGLGSRPSESQTIL